MSAAAAPKGAAPKAEAKAAASAPKAENKDAAAKGEEKKVKKAAGKKKPGKKGANRKAKTITIDCSEPVDDDIFDIASFEQFLHARIKVGGKVGVLGDSITITREGNVISVTAKVEFAKRYLKYLTKKFLKKQLLRDYIRVIARTKSGYFLRYFNFNNQEEGAEADS